MQGSEGDNLSELEYICANYSTKQQVWKKFITGQIIMYIFGQLFLQQSSFFPFRLFFVSLSLLRMRSNQFMEIWSAFHLVFLTISFSLFLQTFSGFSISWRKYNLITYGSRVYDYSSAVKDRRSIVRCVHLLRRDLVHVWVDSTLRPKRGVPLSAKTRTKRIVIQDMGTRVFCRVQLFLKHVQCTPVCICWVNFSRAFFCILVQGPLHTMAEKEQATLQQTEKSFQRQDAISLTNRRLKGVTVSVFTLFCCFFVILVLWYVRLTFCRRAKEKPNAYATTRTLDWASRPLPPLSKEPMLTRSAHSPETSASVVPSSKVRFVLLSRALRSSPMYLFIVNFYNFFANNVLIFFF